MRRSFGCAAIAAVLAAVFSASVWATETENQGIQVLPVPGAVKAVKIDGKFNDWDLTGGIFACGDAETQRDSYGVWIHTMYDAQNFYILARWVDETPMNNPGVTIADMAWDGDCLQMRIITNEATAQEWAGGADCWHGRDDRDLVSIGKLKNAKAEGAQQAFTVNADKKGYVQEIAIPWKLLTKDGQPLTAGSKFIFSVEPNFTLGQSGRLSIKDIFRPGVVVDRVFTFRARNCWGIATLEAKGNVPLRSVRLSDAREFSTRMEGGLPVVNWDGLVKEEGQATRGFKTIEFDMPEDGYVSMNISNPAGVVVRQLLSTAFYKKGKVSVKWDGLTTSFWRTPGQAVPAGEYTWKAIYHKGIGLKLRGWASNGGNAPWDNGPTTGWGGDHGAPTACATLGDRVYLGWDGSEAGRAVVACDLQGNVQWRHKRGGFGGALFLATDGPIVYVIDSHDDHLYCLNAKGGDYAPWAGSDQSAVPLASLWGEGQADAPKKAAGFDVLNGKAYLTPAGGANFLAIVDIKTGKLLKKITLESPGMLKAIKDDLVYVVSGGQSVLAVNPNTGDTKPVVQGLSNATGIAVDSSGSIFVGGRDPDNQVKVFTADGKPVKEIGRKGGRPLIGPWVADGLAFISAVGIDREGKLWITERDHHPKRASIWDPQSGKLVKEFFGATHYGAGGAAISPLDPNLMVGEGCEWRIDPATGRESCTGVIERSDANFSRFCPINGKVYLAALHYRPDFLNIFERLADGKYQLRATVIADAKAKTTRFWADENGDAQEQPGEVATYPQALTLGGYYLWCMYVNTDLTITAQSMFKVGSFTACGAPKYDLANAQRLPAPGVATLDNALLLETATATAFKCYDTVTGALRWEYPNTFHGVHGSHNAPPPVVGLIRGAFGPVGSATLPSPIGRMWAINTNVGEWHLLTEGGFYLTRLFQGDPLKVAWPEKAIPGAIMDNVPPGLGGEDFGGSMTQTQDGKVYIQAGKVGVWNLEVTGLETVKALPGSTVAISQDESTTAQKLREQYLQESKGALRATAKKMTPAFTGDIAKDFAGAEIISFKKQDDAAVRSATTWDDQNLYLAWEVKDNTPWTNSASEAAQLYLSGDTVDFQLGTDPKAKTDRAEAVAGDLRLSIGNLQGKATAVIYRKVSAEKKPMTFSSGVVKQYPMDYVNVLADAKVEAKATRGKGYIVEAAIPLAALGLKPAEGLTLRGDFGVTHGDPAGDRTRLRTYWSNQATGIVDDAVFELKMEPKNWGEISFKE